MYGNTVRLVFYARSAVSIALAGTATRRPFAEKSAKFAAVSAYKVM
jgi:hypothetical protein